MPKDEYYDFINENEDKVLLSGENLFLVNLIEIELEDENLLVENLTLCFTDNSEMMITGISDGGEEVSFLVMGRHIIYSEEEIKNPEDLFKIIKERIEEEFPE